MSEPLVSLVIPALDEEADIAGCIEAIGAQDHPLAEIEVLVVDGCSTDRTVEVARQAAEPYGFARMEVLSNPLKRTSVGLDVGLAEATGTYLVRVDARARLAPGYVRRCVEVLGSEPSIGVVGGAQRPVPRSSGLADRGIARALDNRFATGLSRYRRSRRSGPSDTVWMGSFRTDQLRVLGGWSAHIGLSEDWELNSRYRRSGAVVWFDGDLSSGYLPRTSYRKLVSQYFAFGHAKGTWWSRGGRPAPRQVVLVAVPVIATGLVGVLVHRKGPIAAALVPAGLLAVDHLGSDRHCGTDERAAACVAMAAFTGAWWVGVVAGIAGALVGTDRHPEAVGPAPAP